MDLMVERRAGVDIGKDEVVACVRTPARPARATPQADPDVQVRSPPQLEAMADWFASEGVTEVVMEATGSYWKSLGTSSRNEGSTFKLVNVRHVKILPGRKTDVADAEWLAELLEHGLLRSSFVPPAAIRGAARPDPLPQTAGPRAHLGVPGGPKGPRRRRDQARLRRLRRLGRVRPGHAPRPHGRRT